MNKERNIGTLTFAGENLCCNFINTVYAWRGKSLHEYLGTYDDFIDWCKKADVTGKNILKTLQDQAKQKPAAGKAALKKIKEIRLLLYQFLSANATKNQKESKRLLPQINSLVSKSMSHVGFAFKENKLALHFDENKIDLTYPVWIILFSLYNLLTKEYPERIKECPLCGWIFLDTTKNGKRRWCDPSECGTTDKMKRYYKRRKKVADK